jgi:hypothetical protein
VPIFAKAYPIIVGQGSSKTAKDPVKTDNPFVVRN